MSTKRYIGVRIDDGIYKMIEELAAYNKMTVSKTIRTIFQYVPKLHALIPVDKLEEIRGKE